MCGIFGIISNTSPHLAYISQLAEHAQQRGKDSSGLIKFKEERYHVYRADYSVSQLLKKVESGSSNLILGHSRLITNGHGDNQPVIKDGVIVIHNGIIVNCDDLWNSNVTELNRDLQIDTEIIAAITLDHINEGKCLETLKTRIFDMCIGVISCAIVIPKLGKLVLLSNNGSLYYGIKDDSLIFASERYILDLVNSSNIIHIVNNAEIFEIPSSVEPVSITDYSSERLNLVPQLSMTGPDEKLLEYRDEKLDRCTKCILPSTMPFIEFNQDGVCNYCLNYELRNVPKERSLIFDLLEKYRRKSGNECIVPFSGGRDSCYALHLIVNELELRPVAYTYDWGMVTDLGRRNISRMCAKLGVENIIVAADIEKKRRYIANNIRAWLKSPHLGMVSIFTAGDKHFFRHVETVKEQTGISLNLWGINPLEVTHFKSGFLGVPPDFEEKRVYSHGILKQLRYQYLRLGAMLKSPLYFNRSVWDTLSGEYYRSFTEKSNYYHVYDYWRWDEELIDKTLLDNYDWEKAPDTQTTWRIGDGTAAFYNYIYYTVAGFTEHDTFRSNQIREGQLNREDALELVKSENAPRYPNIKWYLDTVGIDFKEAISVVNSIPKLYG